MLSQLHFPATLSPESRQKLLSTPFAQRSLRFWHYRKELTPDPNSEGVRLRQAYIEKHPSFGRRRHRISVEAFEESLVRVQLLMIYKFRQRFGPTIEKIQGMVAAVRKLGAGKP